MKRQPDRFSSLGRMLLLSAGLGLADSAASTATAEFKFAVLLNETPIGQHVFRVTDQDGQKLVESEAAFDVKFLFINAYRYRHSSKETWSEGCLRRLTAWTNDNGTE